METTLPITYSGQQTTIRIQRQASDSYSEGDAAEMQVQIDDTLVRAYAEQYGDRNPIHLDDEAGRKSLFGARIAHGMLSFNFFSTVLGAGFPGPGTIFTGIQEWRFTAPVLIGDKLDIKLKVSTVRRKKNGSYDLVFDAAAVNSSGRDVMSGRLAVIAPAV